MVKVINNCRLCGTDKISIIWDFGSSPLANAFKSKEDLDKKEPEFPLSYFKCLNCHSVQLKNEIDSDILFKDYLYESPPNLVPHFKELAATTSIFLGLKNNDLVIDIGSNNGLLLNEYKKLGNQVYGIEPAKNIAEKARVNGIPTFNNFFDKGFAQYLAIENVYPKLITSTNCFAHLSDLNEFVEGLSIAMGNDSYFVFENAYLLKTLENLDFGQCYFEHFYLHSIWPLETLFDKHGLELFKIEYNNVQMGSLRGYVRKKINQSIKKDNSVKEGKKNEADKGMLGLDVYKNFIDNIQTRKEKLLLFLCEDMNKSVVLYGWPAKMTIFNKYFGLEKYIDYVVEESAVKIGKFAPGTKMEIKSLDYLKNNPTDIILVGAYNFIDDIKNKNKWYNGRWINPIGI